VSKERTIVLRLAALLIGLLIALGIAEVVFRVLERREAALFAYEGSGGLWIPDTRWAWKPAPGWFRVRYPEFVAEGNVNEHFMNDVPVDPVADAALTRIYAVGDSHTFATGVSQPDTWPKQLERLLNRDARRYRVYNAGTTGYNMHQYVLRVTDQGPIVKPNVVIVAVTFASDFFDLLPPDHGGWIHGESLERNYFDFDERGELVERPLRANLLRDPDRGVRDEHAEEERVLPFAEDERDDAGDEQDQIEDREDVRADDARVRAARRRLVRRPGGKPARGLCLGEAAGRHGDHAAAAARAPTR
jgi:hypothetical protein